MVKSGKFEFCIRVSSDGHPDGEFSKPLFRALKDSPNPSLELVLGSLLSNSPPDLDPVELWPDEQYACSSDYECRIDLDKRSWKYSGHKQRTF